MTDQDKAKFKEVIFDPVKEGWDIIKWMRDTEPKDDAFWEEYLRKANDLPSKYGNTEIARSMLRVVLDAGTEYNRIKG